MNNRMLGIIGSALLILGIFMPIVTVVIFSFSYFNMIQLAPGTFFTGLIILLLGIGSLALSLKGMYKPLVATGILSLALLAFDFYRIKSWLSQGSQMGTETSGGFGPGRMPSEYAGIGWGLYLMAIAAIILIVAGVKKNALPVANPGYGAPPPPPYPPS